MANVCLIYPRDINLNFFPLGLGGIASYLISNSHNVSFLDITEDDITLLGNTMRNINPDIIGISITTPQLRLADTIIKFIRKLLPDVPIVAGGIHPSYFKDRFLMEYDVDYIVYGEGEVTMNELANSLDSQNNDVSSIAGLIFRQKNNIAINPPRKLISNISLLPFPARELVNYETYLQPPGLIRGIWTEKCCNITTSRGCPGKCTFCGVNYLWGNKYRRRTVDNVLKEIDFLVERYDIDGIYFMDDTFLINTPWIEEFCDKFASRYYKIKWSCYGRVDTINDRKLKAIKKAGCIQVEYGIESCSDRVLKTINKRTNKQQITKSVAMTKEHGLRVLGSFIFGFPNDNEADLQEAIDILPDLKLDFSTCYFATPYPGSQLYEQAIQENRIIDNDMSRWYVRNDNIMKINLDPQTLSAYRNKFLKACRVRNNLFFLKQPDFFIRLILFIIQNYRAFLKSIKQSLANRCLDDLGYYFYAAISTNTNNRNIIRHKTTKA